MGQAIIGAAAALAGVLLQSLISDWRARTERRRREFTDAIHAVLHAFVDFRAHQYLKISARRNGEPDTPDARRARYAARSALTTAIDHLHTATRDQALLDAAEDARQLAVALGDTVTDTAIDEAGVVEIGERARRTHTVLRQAAQRALHG